MEAIKKEVILFGIIAIVGLVLLFVFANNMTGAVFVLCPEGYTFNSTLMGGNCVEDVCWEPGVKCMREGNFIKRPDCVCWRYIDKILCGIQGAEATSIKSPNCTRQGHLDKICGKYDSRERMCVSI